MNLLILCTLTACLLVGCSPGKQVEQNVQQEVESQEQAVPAQAKKEEVKPEAIKNVNVLEYTGLDKIVTYTTKEFEGVQHIHKHLGKRTIDGIEVYLINEITLKDGKVENDLTEVYTFDDNKDVYYSGLLVNGKVNWEDKPSLKWRGNMELNKEYTSQYPDPVTGDILVETSVATNVSEVNDSGTATSELTIEMKLVTKGKKDDEVTFIYVLRKDVGYTDIIRKNNGRIEEYTVTMGDVRLEKAVTSEQSTSKLLIDKDFLKEVASNNVPGLDIKLGSTKAEIEKIYGSVIETGEIEGDKYSQFEKLQGATIFFNDNGQAYCFIFSEELVDHTNFSKLKAALGEPADEYKSGSNMWALDYQVEDIMVSFIANDPNSPASLEILGKK